MEQEQVSGPSGTEPALVERGVRGLMVPIRVLVVEDFIPFRNFVCLTLGKRPNLQVLSAISDGQDAVHQAEELKPDLILLDIGLPRRNGIDVARQIRKFSPESKIIFVTQESSVDVVHEAFRAGAQAYVLKTSAGIDLPAAVEAVLDGGQFVSAALNFTPGLI